MISVIVPVYNVKPYLRKCLDSIVNQIFRDLEILIIDDGSTDGSGEICDEYRKDERVKVFHTGNQGLSAARNLGLDNATGDWIGFVDSDDWIEPDMYEMLIKKAEETEADVVECGLFLEYPRKTEERLRPNAILSGMEAIRLLIQGKISNAVWNKLWKRKCFDYIRFPVGRVFEEYATTYRVYATIDKVCTINTLKYHYLQRKDSLAKTHDMKNLTGFWHSHIERYEFLTNCVDDATNNMLIRACASAIARTWAYYCDCTKEDRNVFHEDIQAMHLFTKRQFPYFGDKSWGIALRIGIFFPHYLSMLSFRTAWIINRLHRQQE